MKRITKIVAVAAIACTSLANADQGRKVVILETGKGGIELILSAPGFVSDPTDFSGNPGVSKFENNYKGQIVIDKQAAFGANIGATGKVSYSAQIEKTSSKNSNDGGFTNSSVAEGLLKKEGLKFADAKIVSNKPNLVDGNINVTYTICAQPITDHPRPERECAIVSTSVTKDHLQSAGVMVAVIESNVQDYNESPEKYYRRVEKAFDDLMQNSTARMRP